MSNTRKPDRVQTGLRIDRMLIKVLKGLAEYKDMSLADLVEGILLYAIEGKAALTETDTLDVVEQLRTIYGMDLTSADAHQHPD